MTAAEFDEIIHAPLRLRLCASLVKVDQASFALLRDLLDVSDSTLSKHLSTLEGAGYVKVTKAVSAGRVRTTLSLTRAGRRAYAGHLAALRAIVDDAAE
ncbi:MAG: helix-turn-helix domain-containing protein [Cellulomonadaceae bacterium]|nr:helix-turn-helix domain-containing protein [Cellulomonadaceae bacterium]